jgi:hypothetical protein
MPLLVVRAVLQALAGWLTAHGVAPDCAASVANSTQPMLLGLLLWGSTLLWSWWEKRKIVARSAPPTIQ